MICQALLLKKWIKTNALCDLSQLIRNYHFSKFSNYRLSIVVLTHKRHSIYFLTKKVLSKETENVTVILNCLFRKNHASVSFVCNLKGTMWVL